MKRRLIKVSAGAMGLAAVLGLALGCTAQAGSGRTTHGNTVLPDGSVVDPNGNVIAGPGGAPIAAGSGGATGVGSGGGAGVVTPGTGGGVIVPGGRDPGHVILHRINRSEYDNTVRDLLGTALQPGKGFPTDDVKRGFDNNSDIQALTPIQVDLYSQAANALATDLLASANRATVVTCDPSTGDACLTTIFSTFGARAFRRPLLDTEVASYKTVFALATQAGATPDEALGTAIEAMLLSPHFLFRVEIDPDPASVVPHLIAPYEMASRLSYTFYSSMPDTALFDAAKNNQLGAVPELEAQVQRLLADPKAQNFGQNFAEQWLALRLLPVTPKNATVYPAYNPTLAGAMQQEAGAFFGEFVSKNTPAAELISANYTFLNDTLAQHYGLPLPGSPTVVKTTVASPQRGGLLTMGGPLTVTSTASRSSVVKRGAWVLKELLCSPPPPPPAGVPPFPETATGTQRQILAAHEKDPVCAACHTQIDGMGYGLENYDGIGAWRTMDGGVPVDASGTLPDKTPYNGPRELAAAVAQNPKFVTCLASSLAEYALGRTIVAADDVYLQEASQAATTASQAGVRDLLTRIVTSDPFRMRRGEP